MSNELIARNGIIAKNNILSEGVMSATTFIKSGGTSSQYLMANGSVSTLTNPITGTGTTNTLPKFGSISGLTNSSLSDDGTIVTSANDVSFGNGKGFIFNSSGTNRSMKVYSASNNDNLGTAYCYPSSGTNVGSAFFVVPKGTGFASNLKTQLLVFNTDYVVNPANSEFMGINAQGTYFSLGSDKLGTGIVRPVLLYAGASVNPNHLWLYTDGRVGLNTATSNGIDQLQVSGTIKTSSSIQVGTNSSSATSINVGAIRYSADSNNSYVDMVMQTGASAYTWVNIVTNSW